MKQMSTNDQSQAFNEYMLNSLQNSRNYRARLEQRNQQAINFFLVMLTALGGGSIVIITSIQDQSRSLLFLDLVSFVMAGFGLLTYFWISTSFAEGIQEGLLQFFLHKYFRDMNPTAFDKYGLSKLLTTYSRTYDKNYRSVVRAANTVTLLALALFTSIMFAVAVYILSVILGKGNVAISVGAGVVDLIFMGFIWSAMLKRIDKFRESVQDIISQYHFEQPANKKAKNKNAA